MASTSFLTQLFTTLAANGNTAAVSVQGAALEVDVFVEDAPTWGSGTLTLQTSPDNGTTWISTGYTWTSGGARLTAGTLPVVIGATQLRLALSGATTPSITPMIVLRRIEFRSMDTDVLLTANGTSKSFRVPPLFDRLGSYMFGTWGSGTLKLQVSPDGGTTWYTVLSKTANDYTLNTNIREGLYRFVLSGATSPSLAFQLG